MSILERYPLKTPRDPRIRKFLFMRYSHIYRRNIPTCVEALNYDDAVWRLLAKYPSLLWRDWDYIQELEPQHDLGKLGETLKFEEPC